MQQVYRISRFICTSQTYCCDPVRLAARSAASFSRFAFWLCSAEAQRRGPCRAGAGSFQLAEIVRPHAAWRR
jgi:hypothetical protein